MIPNHQTAPKPAEPILTLYPLGAALGAPCDLIRRLARTGIEMSTPRCAALGLKGCQDFGRAKIIEFNREPHSSSFGEAYWGWCFHCDRLAAEPAEAVIPINRLV